MFKKYGEFNSAEEINKKAEELLKADDEKGIIALAKENGLDEEDAADYYDGIIEELATPAIAAIGKLKIEEKEYKLSGVLMDWKEQAVELVIEDEAFARAVRLKKKHLNECMAKLIAYAFESKVQVSDAIVNITKVKVNGKEQPMRKPLYLGIPSRAEVKKLLKEYYLG